MKILKVLFLFCLVSFVTSSCGSDDPNDGNVNCSSSASINSELADETAALSSTSTAYANDPTTANCNAYKNAFLSYLNAIKGLEDCYVQLGLQVEWQQSIAEAEASVNSIMC